MKKIIKRAVGVSILLIGATFMMSFLSCKTDKNTGGETNKNFEIEYIKVWSSSNLKGKDKVTVSGSSAEKTLEVKVSNCSDYKLEYELKSKTGSKDARAGVVTIDPFEIERGKSDLYIKLTADGYNKFDQLIKVTREDSDAPNVQVMLKRTEDASPVPVVEGKEYPTAGDTAIVSIVSTGDAEFKTASIAGSSITITDANKKKVEKGDIATTIGNVEVLATFEYYKDLKAKFSLKKVAQGEVPVMLTKAVVFSGNSYGKSNNLEFADVGGVSTASIELGDIQYSCVKLEMEADVTLKTDAGLGLVECKSERSENYLTAPTKDDITGRFSGKLIKELNSDGSVKSEYNTPIVGKKLTEYLIVGSGTVEYKFKLKADNRKETEFVVKITNKNENELPNLSNSNDPGFLGLCGYLGGPQLIGKAFQWVGYSKCPISSNQDNVEKLEYMGDEVSMLFAKVNAHASGDMYFYYTLFDDNYSNKPEFVRMSGGNSRDGQFYIVKAAFDPKEKKVDAFNAFKDHLPLPIFPKLANIKWTKLFDKGFCLELANSVVYYKDAQKTKVDTKGGYMFADVFPYRVQAKTYASDQPLNIGYEQDYKDCFDGTAKSITKARPFLSGKKLQMLDENKKPIEGKYAADDLFVMTPTFGGKIGDSIQTVKYTIKKNGTEESDWKDVSLSTSKWTEFLCLNAKDGNLTPNGQIGSGDTLYKFEKDDSASENYYEIEVTITPKTGNQHIYKYKIDYKTKQSVDLMDLGDAPSADSNLFGVPTSYAECANREVQAIVREIMAQNYAKERLFK